MKERHDDRKFYNCILLVIPRLEKGRALKKIVPAGVSLCTWYNKFLEDGIEYFHFAYPSYNVNGCGFKICQNSFLTQSENR